MRERIQVGLVRGLLAAKALGEGQVKCTCKICKHDLVFANPTLNSFV